MLEEIMRESAKEKLTREVKERIRNQQWEECFYVADELIRASTEANISELEKQQQPGAHETQDQVKNPKQQLSFSSFSLRLKQKVVFWVKEMSLQHSFYYTLSTCVNSPKVSIR